MLSRQLPRPVGKHLTVSAPPGWTETTGYPGVFMSGQTNFQGTAQASGYILPGAVGAFVFQSSSPHSALRRGFPLAAVSGTARISGDFVSTVWRKDCFASPQTFCRRFGVGSEL
jgi:hypothetical protein